MHADMINLDREHLSHAEADHLAKAWNAAYPLMRNVLTREVERLRDFIGKKVWEKDVDEIVFDYLMTEARIRRRLKYVEDLRLELGQLDRGEHRPCTQSPKMFTLVAAHSRVIEVVRISSSGQEGMAPIHWLSALLAEEYDRWLLRMRERSN